MTNGNIMSDGNSVKAEESASYLQKLIKEVQEHGELGDDIPVSSPNADTALPDPITALLSDPEMLLKLPKILSSAKPIIDILSSLSSSRQASVSLKSEESERKDENTALPAFAGKAGKHTSLLSAIKPYLNKDRQRVIDQIIKLQSISELLGGLK